MIDLAWQRVDCAFGGGGGRLLVAVLEEKGSWDGRGRFGHDGIVMLLR